MFEDLMNQDEFTREQLVMIYVINTMNELVDMGLLEGGVFNVTEKGLKLIENLDPTEEEIIKAIDGLKLAGYIG